MSYSEFLHGLTAEEVRKKNQFTKADDVTKEQLRKWRESEHVLRMLRTIRETKEFWSKAEEEAWLKATGKKKR